MWQTLALSVGEPISLYTNNSPQAAFHYQLQSKKQ